MTGKPLERQVSRSRLRLKPDNLTNSDDGAGVFVFVQTFKLLMRGFWHIQLSDQR